jgi:hypothetical protein
MVKNICDCLPDLMADVKHASLPALTSAPAQEPAAINPLQFPGWDEMVAAHPWGTFFHGSAWARVLQETYGHRPFYFGAIAQGRLLGLLPVMELKRPLQGWRGVSLPFTDYCTVLGSEAIPPARLWEGCLRQGRDRGWRSFECRGMTDDMAEARPSLSFFSHEIRLGQGKERLWTGFKSRVRTPIRRAQEAGVKVDFETGAEAMKAYYKLHCQTRRKHGLPPQPRSFFENIQRYALAKDKGWVALARWRGQVVAAGVFVHLGRRAIHKFGASDSAHLHLYANHLLLWETIRRYSQGGFESLELGRTSIGNEGLRQFKLGFGAEEKPLRYCRYDYRANAFAVDRDRVEGWFNPVFRCLPLPLLRLTGRLLYPQLS